MLELRPLRVGIVRAAGDPSAIAAIAGAHRTAPDEALVLCLPEDEPAATARLTERLPASSLVLPDGDSFSVWGLSGPATDRGIARVCAIPLPPGRPAFLQGIVADLSAKLLLGDGRALVIVASTAGHHLRRRLTAACAPLGIRTGDAVAFDPGVWRHP